MKAIEIPFIKFPQDWGIKFMPGLNNDTCLFRFLVKKDGAPNVVSVVILQYNSKSHGSKPFWEVGVCEEFTDGSYGSIVNGVGESTSELSDIESLVKDIGIYLYLEIPDYLFFETED